METTALVAQRREDNDMSYRVSVLPGEGIGPTLIEQTLQVLTATGARFDWDIQDTFSGFVDSLRKTHVGLKGPLDSFVEKESPNQQLRKKFGLALNVRPAKTYNVALGGLDLLTIHHALPEEENTEDDLYIFLAKAFSFASNKQRKKVTIAVKPQFFRLDTALTRLSASVARHYSEMQVEIKMADTVALQLVRRPLDFDVILCNAVYGDILSDIAAALIGGRGFAPSGMYGKDCAVFEAIHGTAQHMNALKANPIALFLSGVMLLRCIGEEYAANGLERAIKAVIWEGIEGLSSYNIMVRVLEELQHERVSTSARGV
jgi:isocitrate dehydrogenase (NAD+)